MLAATSALLVFAAGMMLEGLRLLGLWRMERADFLKFVGCLAFAVFSSAMAFVDEDSLANDPVGKAFFCFFFIFPLIYLFVFKKKVFPTIDERVLLAWNVLFVYAASQYLANDVLLYGIWAISIAVVAALVTNKKMPKPVKTLFYLWYLIIAAVFGAMQFNIGSLLEQTSLLMIFIKGMASLYLLMCAWQIFRMIPIPGKHQSISSRMAEWRDDVDLMAQKFSDHQVACQEMGLMIAGTAALILFNSYFGFVSLPDMISVVMVLTSMTAAAHEKMENGGTFTASPAAATNSQP